MSSKDEDLSYQMIDLSESQFLDKPIDEDINSEDEDSYLYDEIAKKGKSKKKKKKGKDIELQELFGDLDDSIDLIGDDDILTFKKKKGKSDIFDVKKAKKSKKKDIAAKFNSEITNLRKILKDADTTFEDIRKIFYEIRDSRKSYVGKTLTDLLQALNTSISSRVTVNKEISNIVKTILDLQLKADKGKKENKDQDDEDYGANLFAKLFGDKSGNRKNIKDIARDYYNAQDNDEADIDMINEAIENRLSNEIDEYRSEDGGKYIQYESYQPRDVIIYHSDGSWEVDAIDKDGNQMPDEYPRIPKENLANETRGDRVRFNLEEHRATDATGRVFEVIEVP